MTSSGIHWLTPVFVAAVAAETATRLWLANRQIAAVQASREHVPEPFQGQFDSADQRKASDYTMSRVQLGRWASVFEALFKLLLTVGGGLALIDSLLRPLHWREPWQGGLLVVVVVLLLRLLGVPFALWRTFVVEAQHGFNRVSRRLFAVDFFKRLLLDFLAGGPVLLAALMLMDRGGSAWWIWLWLLWLGATLALTWAAPRFIAPLFNRFSPLTDEGLKTRLELLLRRCGYTADGGVFVMDGSRRSAHGNAYFTGIGRNKRIVFLDTLLSRIEAPEIEAVLAHEIGHFRLHHIQRRMMLSSLAALGGLALLGLLAREPGFYAAMGVPVPSAAMALLLFMSSAPVVTFFATPLESWWSRRHEFAADEFAAAHTDARALGSALLKLYRENAATLTPDHLYSAFYDSHPGAQQRIARLNAIDCAQGTGSIAAQFKVSRVEGGG